MPIAGGATNRDEDHLPWGDPRWRIDSCGPHLRSRLSVSSPCPSPPPPRALGVRSVRASDKNSSNSSSLSREKSKSIEALRSTCCAGRPKPPSRMAFAAPRRVEGSQGRGGRIVPCACVSTQSALLGARNPSAVVRPPRRRERRADRQPSPTNPSRTDGLVSRPAGGRRWRWNCDHLGSRNLRSRQQTRNAQSPSAGDRLPVGVKPMNAAFQRGEMQHVPRPAVRDAALAHN